MSSLHGGRPGKPTPRIVHECKSKFHKADTGWALHPNLVPANKRYLVLAESPFAEKVWKVWRNQRQRASLLSRSKR